MTEVVRALEWEPTYYRILHRRGTRMWELRNLAILGVVLGILYLTHPPRPVPVKTTSPPPVTTTNVPRPNPGKDRWWISPINGRKIKLKCLHSSSMYGGKTFCVRDRKTKTETWAKPKSNRIQTNQNAVDLLARISKKCTELVDYVDYKFPDQENVQRLVSNFRPTTIRESYSFEPVAFNEEKGVAMAFCLDQVRGQETKPLVDFHTLFYVAMHEMAHSMSLSEEELGHDQEFWDDFEFLVAQSIRIGIHNPQDIHFDPDTYCSSPAD